MDTDKKQNLINALDMSIQKLHQGIDKHGCLVTSILEGRAEQGLLLSFIEQCAVQPREQMMREAIKEAIEELEESRKAFKSKRLELLRKKLTQVLIDAR